MAATTKTWVNGSLPQVDDVDLNGFKSENNNLIQSAGISLSIADHYQTSDAVATYSAVGDVYSDTSVVASTIVLSAIGARRTPVAYNDGTRVRYTPAYTNEGPSTINVAALGSKAVVNANGDALTGGEILVASPAELVYDAGLDAFVVVVGNPFDVLNTPLTYIVNTGTGTEFGGPNGKTFSTIAYAFAAAPAGVPVTVETDDYTLGAAEAPICEGKNITLLGTQALSASVLTLPATAAGFFVILNGGFLQVANMTVSYDDKTSSLIDEFWYLSNGQIIFGNSAATIGTPSVNNVQFVTADVSVTASIIKVNGAANALTFFGTEFENTTGADIEIISATSAYGPLEDAPNFAVTYVATTHTGVNDLVETPSQTNALLISDALAVQGLTFLVGAVGITETLAVNNDSGGDNDVAIEVAKGWVHYTDANGGSGNIPL